MKTVEVATATAGLLIDARHRAGLTQAELAARTGVSRPLISKYENGKKDPSVTSLSRLIHGCGMELRMHADFLTAADRHQYERDARVGPDRAQRNAVLARSEIGPVRPLTSGELAEAKRYT
jgi:transcriptional regulator with XRE-family HTH domain